MAEKKNEAAVWGKTGAVKPFKVKEGASGTHALSGIYLVPGEIVALPENQASKELFSPSSAKEMRGFVEKKNGEAAEARQAAKAREEKKSAEPAKDKGKESDD